MKPTSEAPAQVPVSELLELDRSECLRRLGEMQVGRFAVNVPDWPAPVIRPVNYVFDPASGSVLIRSGPGSKLFAGLRATHAAFEIDGIDAVDRSGWSVIVQGVIDEITHPAELERVERLGLDPWPTGHKGHWFRIRVATVSGRIIASR